MPHSAHVTSLESLRDFRESLIGFCEAASASLCAIDMDVRRTVEYLTQEKMAYWQAQARIRYEEVHAARNDLSRRHLGRHDGHKLDDTEQKKALRLSQARLAEAEEKIGKIRKWMPVVLRAIDDYRGQLRRLEALLEGEPPVAVRKFDHILAPLEEYLRLAPPVSLETPVSSIVRGEPITPSDPLAQADPADIPPGEGADPAHSEQLPEVGDRTGSSDSLMPTADRPRVES